jgi:hypothetical protein
MLSALVLAAVLGAPPNLAPVATVGRTDKPPQIDAGMDDPCWRTAAVIAPLVLVGTADFPSQQTVARVCADEQNIYVAFWCWEDQMDALKAEAKENDTGNAWADDCVEVFLAPDGRAGVYYHVIVTAANVVDDELGTPAGPGKEVERDRAWSFGGTSATRKWPRGWTCEVALPRQRLGGGAFGNAWLANFARAEQPHGELSAWPALLSGFHETDRFGALRWADVAAVSGLSVKPIVPGVNSVRVTAPPGAPSPTLEIGVIPDNGPAHETEVTSDALYEFAVDEEGEGHVRLAVRGTPREGKTGGGKEEIVFATAPMHYSVPLLSGRLAATTKRLQWAWKEALTAGPRTAALLREIRQTREALIDLRQEITVAKSRAAATPDVWADLTKRTDDIARQSFITLARTRAIARSGGKAATFGLGWQNSLVKLRRDDINVNLGGAIKLAAARDEWESAQLVVLGLDKAVKVEEVSVGPMVEKNGRTELGGENVRAWRLDYVHTRPPVYPVEYVGWWPDPLLPISPTDVQAGEIQPIWLSFYVPKGTAAGVYRGQATVKAADGSVETWPIELTVWDIDLPRPSRLKTAFSVLQRYDASKWYGWEGLPPKDYRLKLYQLLFDHRLNPMSLYTGEMWPPREDMEWCVKHGMNAFNIVTVNNADPGVIAYVKEQADWLRQRGWLPLAYIYGFDEVQPAGYDALKQAYEAVRKSVPKLPRACTVVPNEALKGSVDIWVPLTAAYKHGDAEERRKAGDEVWWYICCGPWHPYANWFIDYPATDARVLFWQTFKYHVTGFLYYEIAMWRTNLLSGPSSDATQVPPEDEAVQKAIGEGKRWPEVPWNTFTFSHYNGDGLLIYPGPGQTPLPSMRLEVIRDGIEDYDLLSLLAECRAKVLAGPGRDRHRDLIGKAAELLAVRPKVVRDMTHYTGRPEAILAERQEVAATILKLKAAMAE